MSVGSDGFTNCNEVCNPENDMAWSCSEYCKGFVFVASTPSDSASDDTHVAVWIVLSCVGGILMAVLVACYCYRRKFCSFIKKCRDKRLPYPAQEVLIEANKQTENVTVHVANDRTGLLPNQTETGENGVNETTMLHENSSDSGISSENSSVHTVDETGGLVQNLGAPSSNYQQPELSVVQDDTSNNDTTQDLASSERRGTIPTKQGLSYLAIGQKAGNDYIAYAKTHNETA